MVFLRFIAYAMFGMVAEIFFTGLKRGIFDKDLTLKGTSYIWMFPIYGSMLFLEFIHNIIEPHNFLIRGTTYAALIMLFEYLSGGLIKLISGKCPWNYTSKFAVKGLIRLDYFPIWFCFGLIFEFLHNFLTGFL